MWFCLRIVGTMTWYVHTIKLTSHRVLLGPYAKFLAHKTKATNLGT